MRDGKVVYRALRALARRTPNARTAMAAAAAIAVFDAGSALAGGAGSGTSLCIPETPGKAVRTPGVTGGCKPHYTPREVGPGPETTIRWNQTANPGFQVPTETEIAKVGPVTVVGTCVENGGGETRAATRFVSTESGMYQAGGYSGGETPFKAGEPATNAPGQSSSGGYPGKPKGDQGDAADWTITTTGDFAISGFSTEGVWLEGEAGAACTFTGYAVID